MWVLSEHSELAYGMKASRTLKNEKKAVEMKTALLKLTEIFFARIFFLPQFSAFSVSDCNV